MVTPALNQLRQLQRSLYEKAYAEAHAIVAGTSRTILAYSTKFERSLPKKFRRTTQAEVLEAVKQRRFILYGDFHTLRQSQRGLLRLMRSFSEKQRSNKIVIALEMFKAIDQDSIDAYLAGNLPEGEFLETVNYQVEWGFPWQNFKMILDFAKSRGLPVFGINSENAGRDTLAQRDRYAARCLVDAAERYPDHKVMCLIGEYHLADGHLPRALSAEMKRRGTKGGILRLLNNVDDYYFLLQKVATHSSTEYLKLRRDFYCIMNSPPWMKWQSFSMWEEMRHIGTPQFADQDSEMDPDLDLHTEESFDIDYQFLHFAKNLAGFLGLTIDASDLESFHLLYSPDGDFIDELTEDSAIEPAEAHRMMQRASLDGMYFFAKTNTVLLTYISINNLAEAAGQYLHRILTGFDDVSESPAQDFNRRILKSAVGMIASKILNPRRKCMELHHFRQFLRRHKGERLTGQASRRRAMANGVVKFDRWIQDLLQDTTDIPPAPPKALVLLDRSSHYELSREIGQMLGFALYKKVIANKEPATRLRRLFKTRTTSPTAAWREVASLYALMLS